MDSPYGNPHHHHHHQRRDDGEDDDRQSFGAPPPPRNFADTPTPPGLYQPQPPFDSYAPRPAGPFPYRSEPQFDPYVPSPPPPYGAEPYFQAQAPPAPAPYVAEPYFVVSTPPPPFGHVSHVGHHTSHQESYQPDHHPYGAYPPHNSGLERHGDHTGVTHVSHHSSHQTDTPSAFHHLPDENPLPDNLAGLAGRKTVKVYSKAEPNYYLTIRDGKVILAPADPSDQAQHWYKDEKYSTRVKDADGHPCFALVNKATGEAMKHSVGATHPVHLIRYDPDKLDESVLWTESKDLGDGYRTIRMVNNVSLNVDAYHGDSKSGGVRDGTTIVLWDWNKGDNQRWKIFPF